MLFFCLLVSFSPVCLFNNFWRLLLDASLCLSHDLSGEGKQLLEKSYMVKIGRFLAVVFAVYTYVLLPYVLKCEYMCTSKINYGRSDSFGRQKEVTYKHSFYEHVVYCPWRWLRNESAQLLIQRKNFSDFLDSQQILVTTSSLALWLSWRKWSWLLIYCAYRSMSLCQRYVKQSESKCLL